MKKKKKSIPQLNKSSFWKLVLFAAIILLVEIVAVVFIYNRFSVNTYTRELVSYQTKSDSIAQKIYQNHSDELNNLENNRDLLELVVKECEESGQFDNYIVFTETRGGKVIYSNGLISAEENLRELYSLEYNVADTFKLNDKTYVFSPSALGESGYRIGGLQDFSDSQAVIDNVLGNLIAALAVSALLVIAACLLYAYLIGNREKTNHFKYRIAINKEGRVVGSNVAFKHEFSEVSEIKDAEKFDKKNFNLINLSGLNGDKLLAVCVGANPVKPALYASEVANADSFVQSEGIGGGEELDADGRATVSLSRMFENFLTKGKRTLLGILYISNLDRIKTLFGKQMALNIQRVIIKKVREKFTYAYELDFAYMGITFPDGKKLDILMSDLEDNLRYVNAPITMEDNLFTLEVKSGFALCDAAMNPLNFENAYKAAEAALQRVLDTKIADYIVYHESQRKLYTKYFITFDIKQMLSEGAFEMEYQPQYNIKQERIEGFEALFRVKKSWNVNVDTFSFITYAERTGAMVQLGDFIFDTGMQFAKRLEGKKVSVSLNVSPVQLMQAGFTENFLRLYKKYNLKPGSICVEITESFLMTNFTETLKKLDILTAQGIDVHLDDFGTEYSSLLYIKKLPISTIKIDKEFVKDVLVSRESQAIIKFITNIAKLLNRTTICEGVETTQEFDMLNYLGCDTIQGWLIGKSMKPDAALQIVDTFDYKAVVAASKNK